MLRQFVDEFGLFLLPFAAYAIFLLLARRNPLERAHWEPQFVRLVLAGIFLVVASLVMTGLTSPRHAEGYVPPHMENGRVVPGGFR